MNYKWAMFIFLLINFNWNAILEINSIDAMVIKEQGTAVHATGRNTSIIDFYTLVSDMFQAENDIDFGNVSPHCTAAAYELAKPPVLSYSSWKDKLTAIMKLPLGKMLDAWGKPGSRLLLGSSQWKGASDECEQVESAKYCLTSNLKFSGELISYGSCFPKECSVADVIEVLSIISNHSKGLFTLDKNDPSKTYCESPKPLTTGVLITMFIMCALIMLGVIGTIFDIAIATCSKIGSDDISTHVNGIDNESLDPEVNVTPSPNQLAKQTDNENGVTEKIETTDKSVDVKDMTIFKIPISKLKETVECNTIVKFFACFSFYKNTKAILSTRVPDGAITSVHGVRVISLAWVILGHFYVFVEFSSKPDNLLNMIDIIHRFNFLPIGNAYVSVDTFFLLSGLLVGYLTLKRIDKQGMGITDIFMYYLHRYIRLTPSLILLILFYANIFPIIVKQPMGFSLSQVNVQPEKCLKYWWQPLLYINNFYPTHFDDGCVPWTWYLANDMQFYIVSPAILLFMVWIEKKFSKGSRSVIYNTTNILLMCTLSILITAVITKAYDIPTLLTSALFLQENPRREQSNQVMDKLYVKPYCRITPYLIGLWLGYLFSRKITLPERGKKIISIIGWLAAITTGILVVYGPWNVYRKNGTFFNNTENIVYSAFHRFAWSCAVGWVIYACHNKVGGLVNSLLSWKFWIPLSRLTYGCYLLHIIVLLFFTFGNEIPSHYQDSRVVFDYISNLVVTFAASFVLSLCVEQPVVNLGKMIFER